MIKNHKKGFTLVEITLAMGFVSVLLITIVIVVMQIISIYQKGLALRAVNSAGRELIDEFSRGVALAPVKGVSSLCNSAYNNADARRVCVNNNADIVSYQEEYATINGKSVPVHGVFCTGRYSYIWNTGYAMNNGPNNSSNPYRAHLKINGSDKGNSFRLVRINDADRSACKAHINPSGSYLRNALDHSKEYFITIDDGDDPNYTELLTGSENNLILYDFVAYPGTLHKITQHAFYSMSFTLGTISGGIDITATGDYCKAEPTETLGSDFNYCAVNKFNFSVRATGELTADEREERGYY